MQLLSAMDTKETTDAPNMGVYARIAVGEMKHGPAYIRPVTRPSCRTWTFEQATLAAAPTSGQNRRSMSARDRRRSFWLGATSKTKSEVLALEELVLYTFSAERQEEKAQISSCVQVWAGGSKADLHLAELLEIQQTFMTPGPANA